MHFGFTDVDHEPFSFDVVGVQLLVLASRESLRLPHDMCHTTRHQSSTVQLYLLQPYSSPYSCNYQVNISVLSSLQVNKFRYRNDEIHARTLPPGRILIYSEHRVLV